MPEHRAWSQQRASDLGVTRDLFRARAGHSEHRNGTSAPSVTLNRSDEQDPRPCGTVTNGRRRRATSARATPAATEAFSDSTGPPTGSAPARRSAGPPAATGPALRPHDEHQRAGGQLQVVEVQLPLAVEARDHQARLGVRRQGADEVGRAGHRQVGRARRRSAFQAAGVTPTARRSGTTHAVRPEGRRRAGDRAEVVRVGDAVDGDEQRRLGRLLGAAQQVVGMQVVERPAPAAQRPGAARRPAIRSSSPG